MHYNHCYRATAHLQLNILLLLYLYWPIHNAVSCGSSTVRRRSYKRPAITATNCSAIIHKCHLTLHTRDAAKTVAKLSGWGRHRPSATMPHRNWHEWEADEQAFYKRAVCYFAYLISLNKKPLIPLFLLSVSQFHTPFSFLSASTSYKPNAFKDWKKNLHWTKYNNTLFQKKLRRFGQLQPCTNTELR
jgi:hypothetical protein